MVLAGLPPRGVHGLPVGEDRTCGSEPHPDGTTAPCHGGTYSSSTTWQGTCSQYSGVEVWSS
ncbi:DUF3761 domain-containing protein [Catenulispora sp. EB89]|uniref:DUF3761 domain-containing protein n=1 Tax=Catenulispora sp. EB89 TaxID=3156257 RepID=UPI0035137E43